MIMRWIHRILSLKTPLLWAIFTKEGYSQTLLIGSDATFGGRRLYFEEHGDYDILDYNYAIENGWIQKIIKSGGDMKTKNYLSLQK